jgi:Uma2 family endonuclease
MQDRNTMPAQLPLVTAEEFARIPDDDHRYELVDGRVARMSPPGSRHAVLATRLAVLLERHVEAHNLGVVMASGGFRLAANPDTVREPDIAFVARERIPETGIPDGFWPGPADLAVEIRSPEDRQSAIQSKVHDYLARGVQLVWVVDPKRRTVTEHRPMSARLIRGIGDVLDASDVIAGFTCPVDRIFDGIV